MRVLLSCNNNNKPTTPGNAIFIDRIDGEREREVEELKKKKGAKVARCFVCSTLFHRSCNSRVLLFLHYTIGSCRLYTLCPPRHVAVAPLFMRLTGSPHASETLSDEVRESVYYTTCAQPTQHVAKGEGKRP